MTEPAASFDVKRVVVVLDGAGHSAETCAAAADLAAKLGAELAGLFVEDINLFRIAALPMARHMTLCGTPLDAGPDIGSIETALQRLAGEARDALDGVAAALGLRHSFQVVRGEAAQQLASATGEADLLIVGAAHLLPGAGLTLGSPLQAAARRANRPVFFGPTRRMRSQPLVVAHSGSRLIERALLVAERLAGRHAGAIDVLLMGEPTSTSPAGASDPGVVRQRPASQLRWTRRPESTPDDLLREVRACGADMLIVASDLPLLTDEDVEDLFSRVDLPIFLVQ